MQFIALDRPLAVFDIESTGLNPRTDRIVELAVVRIQPGRDGARETKTWLLNPTIPIPVETTAIHGITNEMVSSAPTFADKAAEILEFFSGCDLGGFGLSKLDIPILEEEFERCGMHFNAAGRRMFDALRIYHKREPRDLQAALRFFCGEEPADSHGAEVDALSALRVLEGEFAKYPDLPTSPDELDAYLNERDPSFIDREGRFRTGEDGEIIVNFGRKKGEKLRDLAAAEPSWLTWILHGDFPRDTKKVARDALAKWGPRPAKKQGSGNQIAQKAGPGTSSSKPQKIRNPAPENQDTSTQQPPPPPPPTPPQFAALAAGLDAILSDQRPSADGLREHNHRHNHRHEHRRP